MKKILQAFDGASTKPVEGSDSMAKFLRIVSESDINQSVVENTVDLGDGTRKTTNPDGTYSITDGTGVSLFSADGKLIKQTTPNFGGLSQETDHVTGNVTQNYAAGPMNVSQTKDKSGKEISSKAQYNMGLGKLSMEREKGITGKSWTPRSQDNGFDPISQKDLYAMGNKDKEATYNRAMSQVANLKEGANPHKVSLPVQMAMQHYQKPKKEKLEEVSVFKTYFAVVEDELLSQQAERKQLIRQYGQRIAESVLKKNISERVTFNPDGTRTPSFADQMRASGAQPSQEPAPATVPLSKRFDPRFKNGPEPYTIDIDGKIYKFAGRTAQGPGTGEIIQIPAAAIGIRGLGAVSVELGKDGMYYPAPKMDEGKETVKVPVTQKPRQGPLRPQTGAGAHKDKKKDQKQGKEKHKKPFYELADVDALVDALDEAKKTLRNSNPCWKGYKPVGTKKKGGRTVPNCVPKESVSEERKDNSDIDPLQARSDYAQRHGQGQVYKKSYPGDKYGSSKSYAYDIKRTGPKGKLPKEGVEEAVSAAQQAAIAIAKKKKAKK